MQLLEKFVTSRHDFQAWSHPPTDFSIIIQFYQYLQAGKRRIVTGVLLKKCEKERIVTDT